MDQPINGALDRRAIERRWIAYARRVVDRADLHTCCVGTESNGKVRRWPGYLGRNYASGRVLLVGAIHNQAQLFTPEIEQLQAEVERWKTRKSTDAGYLAAVRSAYSASIDQWAGTRGIVWKRFLKLLEVLELRFEQVAFTNLAKCFCSVGASNDRLVKKCLSCYPLGQLVRDLQPLAVFVAKSSKSTDHLLAINEPGVLAYQFNNRTGQNREGERFDAWAPLAACEYLQAKSRPAASTTSSV